MRTHTHSSFELKQMKKAMLYRLISVKFKSECQRCKYIDPPPPNWIKFEKKKQIKQWIGSNNWIIITYQQYWWKKMMPNPTCSRLQYLSLYFMAMKTIQHLKCYHAIHLSFMTFCFCLRQFSIAVFLNRLLWSKHITSAYIFR